MRGLATPIAAGLMLIATAAHAADLIPGVNAPINPFGIGSCHANNVSPEANARWMPQFAAIGSSVTRTPNCTWGAVEPQEGKWKWDLVDRQMDYYESQHFISGGILAGNPQWSANGTKGLPVNNIPGWSAYVGALVKHANGRIKYWELWNEPPNGTDKNQTAADYAKLLVAAYDAAKAVDPTCLVGMAAKSVHVNYMDQVIKNGGKDHFDYIILHPYETLGCAVGHAGTEPVYMNIAPAVRAMLAAQDPSKVNCPIWFTEIGFDSKRGADNQAFALVKAYTMGIAQGIAVINWFEGMDGDSGPMGLMTGKGEKRPAFTALAQMIQYFGTNPTYRGWLMLNDKDYAFVFQGAKGPVLVTWAPKGSSDNLDFGQSVQIIDPLTGTATEAKTYALTDAPIIVVGVPENLVTLAKANKAKPFPWGGDYTNAKSVSVTYGEKNVEKGLHTQSAASIAADVIAYGGSARSGSVPGGTVFMVDPNFLRYTPTPIEISVVVRRDAANHPAKLQLVYEASDLKVRDGYKNGPTYEVPENDQWNTATFRLDDAQFVGMYGFNFRFNAGPYAIQSVTVTKLSK